MAVKLENRSVLPQDQPKLSLLGKYWLRLLVKYRVNVRLKKIERSKKLSLENYCDLLLCFGDQSEWRNFDQKKLDLLNKNFLKEIQQNGFVEPISGVRHEAGAFKLDAQRLHETISAGGLNSRKRALLFVIKRVLDDAGLWGVRNLKILSADGIGRIALIMRGIFPFFLGTEFLPSEQDRSKFFPVPHMDICNIDFEKKCFICS